MYNQAKINCVDCKSKRKYDVPVIRENRVTMRHLIGTLTV